MATISSNEEANVDVLARKNKIAIVVAPHLGKGETANRAAVLSTGLTARHPEIIGGNLATGDGIDLLGFTKVPIIVLEAESESAVDRIFAMAGEMGCTALVFLSRAQGMRSYSEYVDSVAGSKRSTLDIDAVLVYGAKKSINKITGNLRIVR